MTYFKNVSSREEELELIHFSMEQAKYNKELIADLEAYEVETKPNGQIHKTKENRRVALIKALKAENKKLKEFFIKSQEEKHIYQFNMKINENREWIIGKYNTEG